MRPTIYLDIDGVVIGYDGRESYLTPNFNDPEFFKQPSLIKYKRIYDFILVHIARGYSIQILSYVPKESFDEHCKVKTDRFRDWLMMHDLLILDQVKLPLFVPYCVGVDKITRAYELGMLKGNHGDILIDDEMKNLATFEMHGGKSYHPDCFR